MKVLILLSTLFFASSIFAGDKGNGGGAHICPNEGTIQMYDLYEGYTRYNLTPSIDNSFSVEEYVQRALKKVMYDQPAVGLKLKEILEYLMDQGHLVVRYNLNIPLIEDANILVVNIGCSYEQLANWDNYSGNVLVKGEYFDRLDNVNKAALYLHEALYKFARDYQDATNSDEVRRTVAEALNTKSTFFYLKNWAYHMPKSVVTSDKIQSFNVTAEKGLYAQYGEGNLIEMKVHLGNINYYDPSSKFVATIKRDFSKVKDYLKKTKEDITSKEKLKTELDEKIKKAFLGFKRSEYESQRVNVDTELYRLRGQAEELEKMDLGIVEEQGIVGMKIPSNYNYGSGFFYGDNIPVPVTVTLAINGSVMFEKKFDYVASNFGYTTYTLSLIVTQNKQ